MAKNKHIGSSFDSFLEGEGISAEANAVAIKRVLAWQLEQARKSQHVTKAVMASRMGTSRAQLDRVLEVKGPSPTIDTLTKAAAALGKRVKVELVAA